MKFPSSGHLSTAYSISTDFIITYYEKFYLFFIKKAQEKKGSSGVESLFLTMLAFLVFVVYPVVCLVNSFLESLKIDDSPPVEKVPE